MRVILYGSSLFIVGLQASLKGVAGLELTQLGADSNGLLQRARELRPEAIVAAEGLLSDGLSLALLKECPGLQLVALDPERNQLLVLTGKEARALTAQDLLDVIGQAAVT